MLKRGLRLKKKDGFDRVFRSGKPLFFEEIACRYIKNGTRKHKIGLSFGKKYVPLAVKRNYLKRVFSEALQNFIPENTEEGLDIVFFLIKKPRERTTQELIDAVRTLIQKISLK